jgi:starch synthase
LLQAVVKVPLDAFKMDFVFSDVEKGDGTYDSRGGYDYHLPVENSAVRYRSQGAFAHNAYSLD